MTIKRYMFLVGLLAVLGVNSGINFSSSFPIGTYSYLGNENYVYSNREAFSTYMHDLGYNTNIIEVFEPNDHYVADYSDLYNKLNINYLDSIIMDKRWSTGNNYSTYALTTGSYKRFEAEYTNGNAVAIGDNLRSEYWYRSQWFPGAMVFVLQEQVNIIIISPQVCGYAKVGLIHPV